MKAQTKTAIAVVALAGLGLTGCSASPAPEATGTQAPADGGVLAVSISVDPELLDPALLQLFPAFEVLQPMCEGLFRVNPDGELAPVLATGSEVSADGKTVTLSLREGVTFNDGTAFDAEAVKASLERAAEHSPYFASVGLAGVDAPDASTVEIRLDEAYAPLLSDLAGPAGMIVSPTALADKGDDFGQSPVCVGPFQFKDRKAGESVTLERSSEYYDAENIHLDGIEFRVMTDANARLNAVRSGEVQVTTMPDDSAVASGVDSGLTLITTPTYSWNGFIINVDNADGIDQPAKRKDTALASDPLVRQAFSAALNREALAQVGSSGQDTAGCSLISPAVPIQDTADCGSGDPAAAKKLLEKAGVSTPVPVQLMASGNRPSSVKIAQAAQGMLDAAGFEVTIDQCEGMVCLERTRAGDFDVALVALDGTPDPDSIVTPAVSTGGRYATHGLSDPELDKLLDQARTANDTEERRDLYQKAMDRVRDNGNLVIIANGHFSAVVSDRVTGVEVLPTATIDVAHAALTQ